MEHKRSNVLPPRPELSSLLRQTLRRIYIDSSITSIEDFYRQSHDEATWETIAEIAHVTYDRLAFSSERENIEAVEAAVDHAVAYSIASNGLVEYGSLFSDLAPIAN